MDVKIASLLDTRKNNEVNAMVDVHLRRSIGSSFGIGLAGGVDQICQPFITFMRPGSVAHMSDQIRIGEKLKLVDGLTHEQLITLIRNSGECIYLQLEYSLNDKDFAQPSNTRLAYADITLVKENNRIGVTLRGGAYGPDQKKSRPITIMNIRSGSPAHREKRLRVGDRVRGINGTEVFSATLAAAQKMLFETVNTVVLTVEYYINIIDAAYRDSDHVCVKIERDINLDVGIELTSETDHTHNSAQEFFVDHLVPGSAADRCGVLLPGDQIIAINGCKVDMMAVSDVKGLLETSLPSLCLEIIPASQRRVKQDLKKSFLPLSDIYLIKNCLATTQRCSKTSTGDFHHKSILRQSHSTLNYFNSSHSSYRTTMFRRDFHKRSKSKCKIDDKMEQLKNCQPVSKPAVTRKIASVEGAMSQVPCGRMCHQETMEVTLHSYARGSFGLVVHEQISTPNATIQLKRQPIFISYIEKNSPAERSGVLQVGDRILAINGWNSLNGTAEEANQILRHSPSPLTLTVEFDVIESVLPLHGMFNVKLAKRGNNLGIVVRCETENTKGEPVIISEVRVGSVAYRCGSLHSGDRILAVDDIPLDSCTVEEAMRLLQRSGNIVKLRVHKNSAPEQDAAQSVIYSIELSRKGGPLGLTIASNGERHEPVFISQLAPGGLAEKTGALRVGDRILSVNNEPVEGMKAGDVIHLLQQSTDLVTLKIMRNLEPSSHSKSLWHLPYSQADRIRVQHSATTSDSYSDTSEKNGTPVQSIDSAVESLDDSPGNVSKYQSGIQRYVTDEQVPNTSLNCGSCWMEKLGLDSGSNFATDNLFSKRCGGCKNVDKVHENWVKVLEALETVGETEMLRKLEECTTGGNGMTLGITSGSPLIVSDHDTPVVQRSDLRLPYGRTLGQQPYPFASSTSNILVQSSLSPSVRPKFLTYRTNKSQYSSVDRMDSLSLSNDSQTSTSLGDIPDHMVPPKPPRYGPLEPHTFQFPSGLLNESTSGCCLSACSVQDISKLKSKKLSPPPTTLALHELRSKTFAPALNGTTHRVRLRKDQKTNSFGFSVSDGVGDNAGVFINAILPGGPADRCGQIFPYDKILQINDTSLQYLDCDLALPLLHVDEIEMVLYREASPPKSTTGDDQKSCRTSVNFSLHDSSAV